MDKFVDLFHLNTFKVHARAQLYSEIKTIADLHAVSDYLKNEGTFFVLGGGANVLFTGDVDGLVVKNNLLGIEVTENNEDVFIKVSSGGNWIDLVEFCVNNGFAGIENLAFIPGTVGAAVVQNIAAYGQNFEDVFVLAETIDLLTGEAVHFNKEDCLFGYRTSIFKKKSNYFITSVTIRLSKVFNTNISYRSRYESLESELVGIDEPYSIKDIYDAIVRLRLKKLPDWRILGTAGSFFKNPVISKKHFEQLNSEVKELQSYPVQRLEYGKSVEDDEYVKVPAGRLLDELGWKGKRKGSVGTFDKQALVIVNHGGATGKEILAFSQEMAEDIKKNYDIILESEVCIVH